jgi:hypothetical protein
MQCISVGCKRFDHWDSARTITGRNALKRRFYFAGDVINTGLGLEECRNYNPAALAVNLANS